MATADHVPHAKRIRNHILQLLLCLFVIVFSLTALPTGMAWFAENKKVSGSGMKLTPGDYMPVGLACRAPEGGNTAHHILSGLRPGKTYTAPVAYKSKYDRTTDTYNPTANTSANVALRTVQLGQIQWWMGGEDCDFMDQTDSGNYVAPCASGKLTFYVVPYEAVECATCTLSLFSYALDPSGEISVLEDGTPVSVSPVTDEGIASLLRHHILFFSDYDPDTKYYSGWLSDGEFTVDLTDVSAGQAVEVSLYWVWAGYFDQFMDCGKDRLEHPLCAPDGADYAALLADVRANPTDYFIDTEGRIEIDDGLLDNVEDARTTYNMADSEIGVYVDFLEISLVLRQSNHTTP